MKSVFHFVDKFQVATCVRLEENSNFPTNMFKERKKQQVEQQGSFLVLKCLIYLLKITHLNTKKLIHLYD